jgi:hypothetical protein
VSKFTCVAAHPLGTGSPKRVRAGHGTHHGRVLGDGARRGGKRGAVSRPDRCFRAPTSKPRTHPCQNTIQIGFGGCTEPSEIKRWSCLAGQAHGRAEAPAPVNLKSFHRALQPWSRRRCNMLHLRSIHRDVPTGRRTPGCWSSHDRRRCWGLRSRHRSPSTRTATHPSHTAPGTARLRAPVGRTRPWVSMSSTSSARSWVTVRRRRRRATGGPAPSQPPGVLMPTNVSGERSGC